jgi:glutathione synthase/RimK-type ligase-like ATP-grasp enzyme
MKKCAFLTMDDRTGFVIDDEHVHETMADQGWEVSALAWKQQQVPWSDFDAVIIRSAWDYPPYVTEFLDVLQEINEQTRLANSLELVHWNLSKTYLRDLESKGIGIVPTLWGDDLDETTLLSSMEALGSSEMVIKPVVGANGEDAFHISRSTSPEQLENVARLFHKRAHMMQPFMSNVISEGEFSLFYFNGKYSHAILKTPTGSEFRSQEERGATIRAARPEARLLMRGLQALDCVSPAPLYARLDFVRDDNGDFRVMEMELIEPSLYLRMHPEAPTRFARAIDEWFKA